LNQAKENKHLVSEQTILKTPENDFQMLVIICSETKIGELFEREFRYLIANHYGKISGFDRRFIVCIDERKIVAV
jgi:hypothetical protein